MPGWVVEWGEKRMVLFFALLLAVFGMFMGFNGFVVSAAADTVMAQILGAIYLVGGTTVFGLGLVAWAVRSARTVAPAEPLAAVPAVQPAAVPAVQPTAAAQGAFAQSVSIESAAAGQPAGAVPTCVNCGRSVAHRRKVCECGEVL